MREILIAIRRTLALASSEETRDRALAHVGTALEQLNQAILATPQYEDMQKDLNAKNEQITELEREVRMLTDIITEAHSMFGGIVNRDEADRQPTPQQSTDLPALAERIMRIS